MTHPAIGINTYHATADMTTDELVAAAERKALAILSDGRDCRLTFWGKRWPHTRARIYMGGRNYNIDQVDVILVSKDEQTQREQHQPRCDED